MTPAQATSYMRLLKNYGESSGRLRECRWQAPGLQPFNTPFFGCVLTGFIVKLPPDLATFVPAGVLCPNQQRVPLPITNGDRVFRLDLGRDRRGDLSGFSIDLDEENAAMRFRRNQHLV